MLISVFNLCFSNTASSFFATILQLLQTLHCFTSLVIIFCSVCVFVSVRGYATPACSSFACFTWTAISNHFTSWLLNKKLNLCGETWELRIEGLLEHMLTSDIVLLVCKVKPCCCFYSIFFFNPMFECTFKNNTWKTSQIRSINKTMFLVHHHLLTLISTRFTPNYAWLHVRLYIRCRLTAHKWT